MTPKSRRRPSDSPPDLAGEREEFLRTFLQKGARFTEELIAEHHALREHVAELEIENAQLRTQLASNDAIRELLRTIETLERERNALVDRIDATSAERSDYAQRYAEIEAQFNDLATLYVAAFQLHSTLRLDRIARHLNELLLQFVGAARFALFLLDEDGSVLRAAVAEGMSLADLPAVLPGEGAIGEAFLTGIVDMRSPSTVEPGTPIACVPLRLDHDRPLGVLAIYALLAQKTDFTRLDRELFTMLQSHAATALVAANLFSREPDVELAGLAAGTWPRTRLERTATGSLVPPAPSAPPPPRDASQSNTPLTPPRPPEGGGSRSAAGREDEGE